MGMHDKFTRRAKQVLSLAQQEARHFNLSYVGTEHVLLRLIRQGEGVAACVLERHGLTVERVREAARALLPAAEEGAQLAEQSADVASRAQEAVLYAAYETAMFLEQVVSDGHLLLGLVRLEELGDRGILRELGVDPSAIRAELMLITGDSGRQPGKDTPPSLASDL